MTTARDELVAKAVRLKRQRLTGREIAIRLGVSDDELLEAVLQVMEERPEGVRMTREEYE